MHGHLNVVEVEVDEIPVGERSRVSDLELAGGHRARGLLEMLRARQLRFPQDVPDDVAAELAALAAEIAAELGTMRVTEQIDALEIMCSKRELRPGKKHGNIPM